MDNKDKDTKKRLDFIKEIEFIDDYLYAKYFTDDDTDDDADDNIDNGVGNNASISIIDNYNDLMDKYNHCCMACDDDDDDNVNHPKHYNVGKYECIDVMAEITKDLQGLEAVCTGNVLKYIWRWRLKNGVEDLEKARWYLNKLIDVLDGAE